jgi:hypothetical protein
VGWTWEKEADVQDVLSTGQSSRTEQRDWMVQALRGFSLFLDEATLLYKKGTEERNNK